MNNVSSEGELADTTAVGGSEEASEIGYADALAELDAILDELENHPVDVDVLSTKVERAAHLISICRGRIRQADEQVSRIVAQLEPDEVTP